VFQELKKRFTKELVLTVLNLNKKMRMEVNTSDYTTEGLLSIKCEDGQWKPVVYFSKSLNRTERNYEIHDKEMLTVIRGL